MAISQATQNVVRELDCVVADGPIMWTIKTPIPSFANDKHAIHGGIVPRIRAGLSTREGGKNNWASASPGMVPG